MWVYGPFSFKQPPKANPDINDNSYLQRAMGMTSFVRFINVYMWVLGTGPVLYIQK